MYKLIVQSRMRLKLAKSLLIVILLGNVIIWYKIWRIFAVNQSQTLSEAGSSSEIPQKLHRRLARLVTVVIRQFESFENDVATTVRFILNSFPTMTIVIVCDEFLYPPLELDFNNESMRNVHLVNLQPNFNRSIDERDPLSYVHTKYVAFLPDATRLITKQTLQETVNQAAKLGIVAVPVGKNSLNCLNIKLKIKEWSVQFTKASGPECDSVVGKHVTIADAKLLKRLSDPFMMPFIDALYLQTTALGIKVHILKNLRFNEGKPLYCSTQAQWKLQQIHRNRERGMFNKLGIKKVTRTTSNTEWFGCTRESSHCFGSVVNGIPSYLYQNRFTPPCCLAGLRKVAHHVFDKLEEVGIRYWLEGGSLLGAMRNGDILPWDHEIVIGINRDDLNRSPWIVKAKNKAVVDSHGFVWEKATEGEFFKIQYSKVNRLHVNLLPFYAKNGTMTRDSWFLKNKDFPEQFLHPMSSIDFAGRQVPSPNNIRDFLEIKYYKGVIENPEVPGKLSLN
ncbi:ribitol 5-phosphate transferase FKRP [Phymastichus coffea]|uniref:ribitol 5-phosphate transferase FKRP n=1 Tax=Phymastichus coffea TaxID=108790 RepID=UPI00273B46E6|nr:ribitol 5-phosphate transferase FKRP [Phymastichus coffea]